MQIEIDKYVIYNHSVPIKLRSEQEFYKTIERDSIDDLLISSVDNSLVISKPSLCRE